MLSRFSMMRRNFAMEATIAYQPTMEEIKTLRTASEAPIKDCKKALIAAEGKLPEAFEWLRKKGIASATAKAGRSTAEGLVGVHIDGAKASMIELCSETDFVAINERFQEATRDISLRMHDWNHAGDTFTTEELMSLPMSSEGPTTVLGDVIPELIGKMGENIVPRRGCKVQVPEGIICSYLHNSIPGKQLGRAGALVALKVDTTALSDEQKAELQLLGKRIAMHIVASKPKYLSIEEVPEDVVAKERSFLMEQVAKSNKPQNIIDKMIDGRLNKFYSEVVLLQQDHMVEDGNPKVAKVLQQKAKDLGMDIALTRFVRYQVGEADSL